ncbi:MAG: PBP1A family penicillin-binding protein, partial [Lentisphaerae bacterium]|nr:PBP1A family penicillin-binding protein [Lentisphaerota bacterium]
MNRLLNIVFSFLKKAWQEVRAAAKHAFSFAAGLFRKQDKQASHLDAMLGPDTDVGPDESTSSMPQAGRNLPDKNATQKTPAFFNLAERKPVLSKTSSQYVSFDKPSLFQRRTHAKPFVPSVIVTAFRFLIVLVLLLASAGFGIVAGVAKAYIESTPVLDVDKIKDLSQSSNIYDMNRKLITVYTGYVNRDYATIDEIPRQLQLAFVAIEDIRFESHSGIDYKRLIGAFVNNMLNESVSGGSTITQQLIKNRLLSPERTYKRKLHEAFLATQLEAQYDKDEILESYLNTINLGDGNYGVKAAAKDYFGKELSELTLKECAMLASVTQNPYRYNIRRSYYVTKDTKALLDRTSRVLENMYKADFIARDEYQTAKAAPVSVVETSLSKGMYDMPYFVEYVISDVITHLLEQRNLSDTTQNRTAIENEIRTNGYNIYTTVDPEIQNAVQESLETWDKYPKMENPRNNKTIVKNSDGTIQEVVQPQAAAVVVDYHTGELKAIVGGRNVPSRKKEMNRASQSLMPVGSSIKPLAVYGPALDNGMGAATIIDNIPVRIDLWDTERGYPKNSSNTPYGPITLRKGIVSSLNIVAARVLCEYVGFAASRDYLINLGVHPDHINADGPGLALGTSGITPLEMTAAFGAIANGGVYLEPLSFTQVTDSNGKVILDAAEIRVRRQVFKKSTAWLLTDMLTDAVSSGTGTNAKIKGITVAGKTGTNENYRGVVFAGYTPYYASCVWIGHDRYSPKLQKNASGGTFAAPLWKDYMAKIHEGLEDKPIIDANPEDLGLVKAKVCSVSGLLYSEACSHDEKHKPVTDWFVQGNVPFTQCNMHHVLQKCKESGKLATEYCPEELRESSSVLLIPEQSPLRKLDEKTLTSMFPNAILSLPDIEELTNLAPGTDAYNKYYCPIHTQQWQ